MGRESTAENTDENLSILDEDSTTQVAHTEHGYLDQTLHSAYRALRGTDTGPNALDDPGEEFKHPTNNKGSAYHLRPGKLRELLRLSTTKTAGTTIPVLHHQGWNDPPQTKPTHHQKKPNGRTAPTNQPKKGKRKPRIIVKIIVKIIVFFHFLF